MTAPDPTALLALAGQVERLTDGDRSVDAAIEEAIGPLGEKPGAHLLCGAPSREAYLYAAAGYYTSAPSAALGLVEHMNDLRFDSAKELCHRGFDDVTEVNLTWTGDRRQHGLSTGHGAGPTFPGRFARAVTAAALKAAAGAPEPAGP